MRAPVALADRSSGILLHPTSLPGWFGSGDLGPAARRFAAFLHAAGQSWWQMLPVGPTGAGNSPYSSPSGSAGEPLLISLEDLARDGLLPRLDPDPPAVLGRARVDYGVVRRFREPLLRKAFHAFRGRPPRERAGFERFCRKHADWLEDHVLFRALKRAHRGAPWPEWDPELRTRKAAALERARKAVGEEADYQRFLQYLFDRQWESLRAHCRRLGIGLIGDIPLFVEHDSSDVWSHPEIFFLDRRGRPETVAGVPPDCFSRTGQLWGNPLYRWKALRARGYGWWLRRVRRILERFDAARLDHFIGFHRCWSVRAGAQTARRGRWTAGPGVHLLETLRTRLGGLPFIAEDLGLVTPEVKALRDRFGLPGMRVLQFAFSEDPEAEEHRPHRHPRRCVVYTGTHDNDTSLGWLRGGRRRKRERDFALRYTGSDGREFHWDLIRAAMLSPANLAIFPLQDVLGLGSEARMNRPGTSSGNWAWRFRAGDLTETVAERLALLTATYGRRTREREGEIT